MLNMHEKNKELANLRPAVKSTLRTADSFLENKLYYPFPVSVTPPTPPSQPPLSTLRAHKTSCFSRW